MSTLNLPELIGQSLAQWNIAGRCEPAPQTAAGEPA